MSFYEPLPSLKLEFLLFKQTYNIIFLCFKVRKIEHMHVTYLFQ